MFKGIYFRGKAGDFKGRVGTGKERQPETLMELSSYTTTSVSFTLTVSLHVYSIMFKWLRVQGTKGETHLARIFQSSSLDSFFSKGK